MNNIHKQRLIIFGLALVGIIAVFLPWTKNTDGIFVSGVNSPGFQSWGALLALAATIVICTYGEKSQPIEGTLKYIAIALCGIAALLGIYKVLYTIGYGLILIQICSIGALMTALNLSSKKKEKPADINELKKLEQ
jgi:hypothetical protein